MLLTSFNILIVRGYSCFMYICLRTAMWLFWDKLCLFLMKAGWQPYLLCCTLKRASLNFKLSSYCFLHNNKKLPCAALKIRNNNWMLQNLGNLFRCRSHDKCVAKHLKPWLEQLHISVRQCTSDLFFTSCCFQRFTSKLWRKNAFISFTLLDPYIMVGVWRYSWGDGKNVFFLCVWSYANTYSVMSCG